MVKDICKDLLILQTKSVPATIQDLDIGNDLMDSLLAHQNECVGMAGNMIGINKRIIVFYNDEENKYEIMFNPEIIARLGEYEAKEGCLSLDGVRKTTRYKKIVVSYNNHKFALKRKTYHGFTAQIIQHEIDMCNGILI